MRVFIIAAVSADGFIGRGPEHLADWTSKEDKQLFVRLTKEAGTMVMGSRTFDTIGRALPGRHTIVYTSRPENYQMEGVTATTEDPKALIKRLKAEGHSALAICGGAHIYDLFLQSGVVTELYLTLEPLLFGKGITLFKQAVEQPLTLKATEQLNANTVLLHYGLM